MKRRTLAVGFIAAACLTLIGLVAAGLIQTAYSSNLSAEQSKLSSTAEVTAELIADRMNEVGDLEQATVKQPAFVAALGSGAPQTYSTGTLQPMLDQLESLRPEFQFAAVADSEGVLRAIAPADPSLVGVNFSYRDWYAGAMRTGATYVSSTYVSAVAGAPLLVAVATPIHAAPRGGAPGLVTGILVVGYRIGSVQTFADRLAALEQIDIVLTDQNGFLMARKGGVAGQLIVVSSAPEIVAALHGNATTGVSSDTLAAGVPVPRLGWALSVRTQLSATPAWSDRSTITAIAVGLLVALGLGAIGLVLVTGRLERAEGRHAASEAKLRTIQEALTDGIIVFDADARLVSMNPAARRLFDLQSDERAAAAITSRWELIRGDGTLIPVQEGNVAKPLVTGAPHENQLVGLRSRADQTVRWLSFNTAPIHDARAHVTGYVSSVRDITLREDALRGLQVVSRASQQMSLSLEPDKVLEALTQAASELCSAPGEPQRRAQVYLVDGPTMTIVGEHDPEHLAVLKGVQHPLADHPYVQRVLATGRPVRTYLDYAEFGPAVAADMRRARITNSVWVPMARDSTVFAILAVSGRQHGLISSSQLEHLKTLAGMGELALANAELHGEVARLARVDPLTKAANRRALDERIAQLPRTPYAFVAVDVDGLKHVNDTHGHAAGDQLLSAVAAAMQSELRAADVLARTGGDEFVVLMIGADADGARELAKRMRRAVSRLAFEWGEASISVGSAAGGPRDDPARVAEQADAALYVAKQQRRHAYARLA